jgi:hypothetical protein
MALVMATAAMAMALVMATAAMAMPRPITAVTATRARTMLMADRTITATGSIGDTITTRISTGDYAERY